MVTTEGRSLDTSQIAEQSQFIYNNLRLKTYPVGEEILKEKDALPEKPPISHRYLAVHAGIAYFGLSGNVRKERFKMLTGAGVVIQLEDGSLKAVSPEEARNDAPPNQGIVRTGTNDSRTYPRLV